MWGAKERLGRAAARERQMREWLAHGVAFACVAAALKLTINTAASPFRGDSALYLGVALGVVSELGVGLLAGAPRWLLAPPVVQRGLAFVLSAAALAVHAAAFHAHAVLRYLPGRESLAFLRDPGALSASLNEHASPALLGIEALTAAALVMVMASALVRSERWRGSLAQQAWLPVSAGATAMLALPLVTHGQVHHGASNPLLHVLLTGSVALPDDSGPVLTAQADVRGPHPMAALVERVSDVLAVQGPLVPRDPAFPYCRAGEPAASANTPRSIILLILESVGAREAGLTVSGEPVMPALARVARDGLHFERFYASGDKSSQGLLALLSGISAETHRRLLTHAPLANLPSFPRTLARVGYQTVYLHGSDLSFEQQRAYLTQLGIARIVEPSPKEMRERIGWGLPDGAMFERLEATLTSHRREQGDAPILATLFTLSTHDPYVLPHGAPKLLPGDDDYERFVNTLAYTDAELGRFYEWYLANEKPRGTLLAVVGDHTGRVPFPDEPLDTSTGEFEYRFRVPFVLAGLRDDELTRHRPHQRRVGGQLDVPQTLSHLVGVEGAHCHHGRNLLGDAWPAQRYVVSLAGENLAFFYAHDGRLRFMWSLADRRVRVYDEQADPTFRRDLFRADLPDAARLAAFLPAYFQLGSYLNLGNHYAPLEAPPPARAARTAPERPMFVSHRGRTEGEAHTERDNTLAALDAARARGFEWVEIDLQPTRDGYAVLAHDPTLRTRDGRERSFADLTLAEARALASDEALPTLEEALAHVGEDMKLCLEVKPQADVFDTMNLVEGVMRATEGLPKDRVIIDSFSRTTLASFADLTAFEVGYDLPQKPIQDEWLDYAARAGFDWVYVMHPFANAEVVRKAHARGLKVMLYTVNDPAVLARLAPERVDGVITDVAHVWELGR